MLLNVRYLFIVTNVKIKKDKKHHWKGSSVMLLENKTLLISGILGDIAMHSLKVLKENGAYIIGFDIKDPLEKYSLEYIDEFYCGDVMDDRFLDYLKDVCSGRVNVIINNIGEGCSKHFLESDDIDIIQTFQINCLSAMRLSRAFLSDMIDKKQGSIINFSSILSQHPVPTVTSYATAKAALVGFTKSLAIEVAPYSIRVNNLTLGYSNTENNKDYFNSENGKNFIKRFIPTKKLVDKNHLGYLLTYLSSDFSTSITGAAITVDRGHSIW